MGKISRRDFLKQASLASAGLMLGGVGMTQKSYARIVGANERINVGVVGYSDRFRQSLLPSFLEHKDKLNFDMVAVSDLWNMRRDQAQRNLTEKLRRSASSMSTSRG